MVNPWSWKNHGFWDISTLPVSQVSWEDTPRWGETHGFVEAATSAKCLTLEGRKASGRILFGNTEPPPPQTYIYIYFMYIYIYIFMYI